MNVAGVTGLFRLAQETGAPLARVVLAHTVARAVFDVDRMWDAVRPLDNVVSAATQVELRTEATRLAERTARWLLRQPELADDPAPSIAGGAGPVRRTRGGGAGRACRAGCSAARPRPTPSARRGCRRRACPPSWPPRSPPRRCCPPPSTSRSSASGPARPSQLAGQVMQCLAERLGLVPLRELVIALPRDRRWPSMARASLRDDLAMEQASLAEDVLALRTRRHRPARQAGRRVGRGAGTPPRPRSAAQLADIAAGDRHELAELLVAVRTLRGLRRRRQARRLPRPEQ